MGQPQYLYVYLMDHVQNYVLNSMGWDEEDIEARRLRPRVHRAPLEHLWEQDNTAEPAPLNLDRVYAPLAVEKPSEEARKIQRKLQEIHKAKWAMRRKFPHTEES